MPNYTLTYTATMPGSKGYPEKFRIKITAPNEAEAKLKLHRWVQEKVKTTFLSCEVAEAPAPDESFNDLMEALQMMGRLEEFKKKYGITDK